MVAKKKPAEGMYKTKARNLTDAQLKRAGGAKAAVKRTVSVSDTKRITEGALKGKTVGAGGKPLTGTVIMANGDRAVYKDGKRVTNVPKKTTTAKPRGGAGGSVSGGNNGVKSNYKTAPRLGKPGDYQAGSGTTAKPKAASTRAGGTYTKSYDRPDKGGFPGIPFTSPRDAAIAAQRARERARIAARKKAGK